MVTAGFSAFDSTPNPVPIQQFSAKLCGALLSAGQPGLLLPITEEEMGTTAEFLVSCGEVGHPGPSRRPRCSTFYYELYVGYGV